MLQDRCIRLDGTSVRKAAGELLAGNVIVFPTETVYGLLVRYGDDRANRTLREIKGRDASKPFQVLISDWSQLDGVGAVVSGKAKQVLDSCWPGGLTAVLPAAQGATVGVRMPDFDLVRELIRLVGAPIIATSANPAGGKPAANAEEAMAYFADDLRVDVIFDSGMSAYGTASTVVDLTGSDFVILRQGGVSEEQIQSAWIKE